MGSFKIRNRSYKKNVSQLTLFGCIDGKAFAIHNIIPPEYLLYQEKLKTMLMQIFFFLGGGVGWGQIKVNCGRCVVANGCILKEVQLLENMLIEDIKLWGVEEAADNSAKKR